MAVGFPAKTNFATGDVLTATNVNDITGTLNLLQETLYPAGRNKIINGAFNVWQRGTSFNAASNTYTADRWDTLTDKTAASVLTTQQAFTAGTAPVAGYESQYFLRTVFPAGGTYCIQEQRVEDVRTFAGQTVTLSFWAKADATATLAPTITQNFGSGGSTQVETTTSNQTLTTSWARYSVTVAIPSISGKTIGTNSYLAVRPMRAVTASGFTIDIWGVQLEAGSTASPFQTASGSIGGELALCQRYYMRASSDATAIYYRFATGATLSATSAQFIVAPKVTMRTAPTLGTSGSFEVYEGSSQRGTAAPTIITNGTNAETLAMAAVIAGGTSGTAVYLRANNSSSTYIDFNAEL